MNLSQLNAQSDSLSHYFDDGGLSEAKTVIKTNAIAIINGDLPLYLERALGNHLSIEVGAGVLLPYYVPEFPYLLFGNIEINDPRFGYSIWVHPKHYINGSAPEGKFTSFQYRRRNYNQNDNTVIYNDITYHLGLQHIFKNKITIEYNIGVGLRIKQGDDNGLIVPLALKIGTIN